MTPYFFQKVWQRGRGAAHLHCASFPKAASITVEWKLPGSLAGCARVRRRELSAPSLLLSPLSDTWPRNLSISSPTLAAATFLHNPAPSPLPSPPLPTHSLVQCIPVFLPEWTPSLPPLLRIQHSYSRSLSPPLRSSTTSRTQRSFFSAVPSSHLFLASFLPFPPSISLCLLLWLNGSVLFTSLMFSCSVPSCTLSSKGFWSTACLWQLCEGVFARASTGTCWLIQFATHHALLP